MQWVTEAVFARRWSSSLRLHDPIEGGVANSDDLLLWMSNRGGLAADSFVRRSISPLNLANCRPPLPTIESICSGIPGRAPLIINELSEIAGFLSGQLALRVKGHVRLQECRQLLGVVHSGMRVERLRSPECRAKIVISVVIATLPVSTVANGAFLQEDS